MPAYNLSRSLFLLQYALIVIELSLQQTVNISLPAKGDELTANERNSNFNRHVLNIIVSVIYHW